MIQLRDDQEKVRGKLRVALRTSTSVLVYAPTGFGKTVLAAALIKMIFEAGKRVIFCVHRVDLIVQTAKTFEKFGIPFSYIAAGHHYNPYHRVYIASIATLKNRMGKIPANYVLVDEAHLSAAAGWTAVAKHYKDNGARLIGLTGSPERLDGKPLGDVWDVMVMGPSVGWLIEQGHLSKYRAFAPAGIDLSGVRTRNGEYVSDDIDDLMSGKAVLSNAVKHWRNFAQGKRTIAFAPSVRRCEQLAAEFREKGIVAVALDGETPGNIRKDAFIGFADRQIDVIVNCGLFCEGFDLAAQVDRDVTIEAVLQYSPTQSLAKHLQQLGRGLRKKPEPAILLDLVGNLARNGFPDDEREWSLEGRKRTSQGEQSVTCPVCFGSHSPGPKCVECGHVYDKRSSGTGEGRSVNEVDMAVEEIDVEAVRRERQQAQRNEARELAERLLKAKDRDEGDGFPDDLESSIKGQLKQLLNTVTAKNSKSPERWAAHVITARLAKQREKHGAGA